MQFQVETLAGTTRELFKSDLIDGVGATARFGKPRGLAVEPKGGNVYVCDSLHHCIRRISLLPKSYGLVSTIIGSGRRGLVNGEALESDWKSPTGLAFDWNGNLLVADKDNHVIRSVSMWCPERTVSTLAGSGKAGYQDGPNEEAQFNCPTSIAVDLAEQKIYVSDSGNHAIRVIRSDGTVATLAGRGGTRGYSNQPRIEALFNWPYGICFDSENNLLYVCDSCNNSIRTVSVVTGEVSTLTGGEGCADGKLADARWQSPMSISLDPRSRNLYVADYGNHRIRQISPDGNVVTIAGGPRCGSQDGDGKAALFANPSDVAVDQTKGFIFVSDFNGGKMRKITPRGTSDQPNSPLHAHVSVQRSVSQQALQPQPQPLWSQISSPPIYYPQPPLPGGPPVQVTSSHPVLPPAYLFQTSYVPPPPFSTPTSSTSFSTPTSSSSFSPPPSDRSREGYLAGHPALSQSSPAILQSDSPKRGEEVLRWLQEINLEHLFQNLIELGISDMDSLSYLEEGDIEGSVKVIERRKLLHHIAKRKTPNKKISPSPEKNLPTTSTTALIEFG
eukprot:TRINITY_DN3762_c0_g1_i2.p2 TRINITY_DN3762_c0_g1~~TRINITY_DN3762_c0_g1_i2.p2  ORF type:complete len:559 (-),score=94.24 TRINITY_DN3762_c0_g1_i2:279-1955(-)